MVEATRLLVQPMRVLVHEMCVSFRRLGDIPRKSADWSNARVHWFSKTAFRSTWSVLPYGRCASRYVVRVRWSTTTASGPDEMRQWNTLFADSFRRTAA